MTVAALAAAGGLLAFSLQRDAPPAVTPEVFPLLGHSDSVLSVAWSPDGRTLASGSFDNTLKLWAPSSGSLLRTLSGHSDSVLSVAWSPDGRTLASGSNDNTLKLWAPSSGSLLRTLSGHSDSVLSVAWSPDGRTLASGSNDNTLKLWDTSSGSLLRTLSGHSSPVSSVAWSPDGRTLASGSNDNTLKLWDTSSGSLLRTLSGHSSPVSSVAWSPDGRTLASGSFDNTLKLWAPSSGSLLRTLSGHSSTVRSVAWSPDGRTLASGSNDNTLKLWAPSSGSLLRTLSGRSSSVLSVAWSPDGRTLASGSFDNTLNLWDTSSGSLLRTLSGHSDSVLSVAWSPDGRTLASGSNDNTLKLWDTSSGSLLRTLSGHSSTVWSVAWSPDGRTLASGSDDNTLKLWDTSSGSLLRTLSGRSDSVLSVAWSPDGRTLASGSNDNTLKLWDTSSGSLLRTLSGHSDSVLSVAWSPDGRTLASGSFDNTLNLWDTSSGSLLRTLSGHSSTVWSVAWSSDGRTLASGSDDNTLKLWDTSSGSLLRTLSGHSSTVRSVAWSPDGRTLASGSDDNTLKLWAPSSGSLLRTLSGHSSTVRSVAWSPDGRDIGSGSMDGSTGLWESTGDLKWFTCGLPGAVWLTYHPLRLLYTASPDGESLAAVRFDSRTSPVYPLAYYREQLRQDSLSNASTQTPPLIQPRPLRLAWDRFENKSLWFGAFTALYLVGFVLVLFRAHRRNPMTLAQQFFSSAGFPRIQRLSKDLLRLGSTSEGHTAFAMPWQEPTPFVPDQLPHGKGASAAATTVYVLYQDQVPEGARDKLRERLDCEVIPLSTRTLDIALSEGTCSTMLREVEDRFATRIDPYDEAKPVDDPAWFHGRVDLIDRLSMALKQGQHAGLFGLRKVGKTSLIKQLRNRAQDTPVVYIDCQASGVAAAGYFQLILDRLRTEFGRLAVPHLPPRKRVSTVEEFSEQLRRLHERWHQEGRSGPFVLMLDELDKLFVDRRRAGSEQLLSEYIRLFRPLRALAQERSGLAVLATSYRAEINRQNALSATVGENPMFMSFQEYFLGTLDASESRAMVEKIGAWKGIRWEPAALEDLYTLCGGHPFLTRLLASDACEAGRIHAITSERVRAAAQALEANFPAHRIGQYYKEAIWNELRDDEQQALLLAAAAAEAGLLASESPRPLKEALTQIEQYGLVQRSDGRFIVGSALLRSWLTQQEFE
ncbi:AAA family ATPase [Stigmatella sp. ncwal1]|uniref:AAA family ATPase n=1 Tax=Stigmatella ashevillensis TaxID=2995309 RepID=A0ABT5D6V7_9BACT|nr:AAA family ATPase [Stigmatella ashevillena]MDC0708830.1 AAA family ATPase [Stigmatella ashevillena]